MANRIITYFNSKEPLLVLLVLYLISAVSLYKELKLAFFMLVLWGLVIWFGHRRKLVLASPIKILLTLFFITFLSMTLSILFQGQFEQLFRFEYENFRDLIFLYFIAFLFTYFRLEGQAIFKLIVFSSLYVLVYVILVLFQSPVRGEGLLETPIARGNMGMLIGVMSLITFFGLKQIGWRILALIGFFSGVGLSILSGSRGGWLTLLIVLATLLIVFYRYDRRMFWTLTGIFIIFFTLLSIFWSNLPIQSRMEQAISDVHQYMEGNPRTSVGYRFEMWKAVWLGFIEKPIFGWGFASFDTVFSKFSQEGVVVSGFLFGHPHNDYAWLLVEKGLLGFLIVLSVLFYPLFKLFSVLNDGLKCQNHNKVFLSLLGIVLIESILEFSLTDKTISMSYQFHFYIVFILIIFVSLFQTNQSEAELK